MKPVQCRWHSDYATDRTIQGSNPSSDKKLFSSTSRPVLGTGVLSRGLGGWGAKISPASNEVKNEWGYTSTLIYHYGVARDSPSTPICITINMYTVGTEGKPSTSKVIWFKHVVIKMLTMAIICIHLHLHSQIFCF